MSFKLRPSMSFPSSPFLTLFSLMRMHMRCISVRYAPSFVSHTALPYTWSHTFSWPYPNMASHIVGLKWVSLP